MAIYTPSIITGTNFRVAGSQPKASSVGFVHGKVTGGGLGFTTLATSWTGGTKVTASNVICVAGFDAFQLMIVRNGSAAETLTIDIIHVDDSGSNAPIHTDSFSFAMTTNSTGIATFGAKSTNFTDRIFTYIKFAITPSATDTFTTIDLVCASV
jgi:hypothetical protein